MSLLIFCIIVLVVVAVVCGISYQVPWPPPMAFLRWVIPVIAMLIGLIVIVQKAGLA